MSKNLKPKLNVSSFENKRAQIRPENDAFKKIRPALEDIGWRYVEKYVTYFEYQNSLKVVITSALKLEKEGTILAMIPYEEGIEISKEGLPVSHRIFYFTFINNLLYFLIKNGIKDIYRPLFDKDGYTVPKDRTKYEKRLINDIKELGFVAIRESNKARLDVNSFLEQYDMGDIDYGLLSKSFADRISSIVDKTVEVHYKFIHSEDKNFIVNYHFENYDTIRKKSLDLIKGMSKDEPSNLILKTFLSPAFETASLMSSEERDILQQAFTDVLERALTSDNYRLLLRQIGFVIIGTAHCEYKGFENGIDCYGLILNQKSHHFQIRTIRRA
jgi:hypothetical protein